MICLVLPMFAVAFLLGQKAPPKLTPYQLSPGMYVSLPVSPRRFPFTLKAGKMWFVHLGEGSFIRISDWTIDPKGDSADQCLYATVNGFLSEENATETGSEGFGAQWLARDRVPM